MIYYVPLFVVVLSNTVYHICSKSTPGSVNAFASLSATYLVGAAGSFLLYVATQRNLNILAEYKHLNWASYLLGFAIIGLEAGYLWMYRVGWPISSAQVVQATLAAIALAVIGILFFKESISVQKVAGIVVCMVGLYLLNKN